MHRDFTLHPIHWCGRTGNVYLIRKWLPRVKLIDEVCPHRAVEVVTAIYNIRRDRKVPDNIDCLWSSRNPR